MNKKKFLDEIQSLIDEAEREAGKHQAGSMLSPAEQKPEAVKSADSAADFSSAPADRTAGRFVGGDPSGAPNKESSPCGAPDGPPPTVISGQIKEEEIISRIPSPEPPSTVPNSPLLTPNLHSGHRARVKMSADRDPDFTTFSDHEVLEYILFNTIPRIDVNPLAHLLIETFGSFSGVLNANINELKQVSYVSKELGRTLNVGEETARSLICIIPAARKAEMSRLKNQSVLNHTAAAAQYLQPYFMNRGTEHVYLASLNNSDRVISVDLITVGDTNFSTVEIKKIVETACRHKAAKVVIAHNHPAGTLQPSQDDTDVTARLVIALMSINIVLSDHLIFAGDGYYSFFAHGDFESIYTYIDSIFGTNLVKEIRLKPKNYRAGVYPSGIEVNEKSGNAELPAAADSVDGAFLPYALGHPSPRKVKPAARG
ncbi:MAG: hypothetical protein FWD58_09560 [Firmicutes bacterium]|nr:hypothetical protein [Bacillota bacterium]